VSFTEVFINGDLIALINRYAAVYSDSCYINCGGFSAFCLVEFITQRRLLNIQKPLRIVIAILVFHDIY
jgi:hypothetical protein